MKIGGLSPGEYKREVHAACVRHLNEYRVELGLEPVDDLPHVTWIEVLRSLRSGRRK